MDMATHTTAGTLMIILRVVASPSCERTNSQVPAKKLTATNMGLTLMPVAGEDVRLSMITRTAVGIHMEMKMMVRSIKGLPALRLSDPKPSRKKVLMVSLILVCQSKCTTTF